MAPPQQAELGKPVADAKDAKSKPLPNTASTQDDGATALFTASIALDKAQWDSEFRLRESYYGAIIDVAKSSIDRSRDSAKYVQTAASAIAVLYSGILGLVFAATSNPLPLRGVWAVAFLGLAVALSTAFLAFIVDGGTVNWPAPAPDLTSVQRGRVAQFTQWAQRITNNRRWAIRASVLSLAFGVLFIAAPFVSTPATTHIPDTPAAPQIPAAVAAPISDQAVTLFDAQVKAYQTAVRDRDTVLRERLNANGQETDLNWLFAGFALLCLLAVIFGPLLWATFRDPKTPKAAPKKGPSARTPATPPAQTRSPSAPEPGSSAPG